MPDNNYFLFVVDTDTYAGSFYRHLTAWCTGQIGECEVGAEDAAQCAQDAPGLVSLFEDTMLHLPDAQGCRRPTDVVSTPGTPLRYHSVAMFFTQQPTPETLAFLMQRARLFAQTRATFREPFTILGFRLLRHVERDDLVAGYPADWEEKTP